MIKKTESKSETKTQSWQNFEDVLRGHAKLWAFKNDENRIIEEKLNLRWPNCELRMMKTEY